MFKVWPNVGCIDFDITLVLVMGQGSCVVAPHSEPTCR